MSFRRLPRPVRLGAGISFLIAVAFVSAGALLEAADFDGYSVQGESGFALSGENLLRLHVIAHSNAPEDQEAKLKVRDALLHELETWPLPADPLQLERWIRERRAELVAAGRRALDELGHHRQVRIEVGFFPFPDKRWGELVLPAGEYRAVRVVIGDGAGENWWCVLFPPLCFVEEDEPTRPNPDAPTRPTFGGAGALGAVAQTEAGPGAQGGAVTEPEEPGEVVWKLRLWEAISQSAAMDRVKDLVDASLALVRKFSL